MSSEPLSGACTMSQVRSPCANPTCVAKVGLLTEALASQDTDADVIIRALGLQASADLGFQPEYRRSGAGDAGRRQEKVPYNGTGHWCTYGDLRRAAAKHVDDAEAAIRSVLEKFGLWEFYDEVGSRRANVESVPRQEGRPLTDAANRLVNRSYFQMKNVVIGLRWEVCVLLTSVHLCLCTCASVHLCRCTCAGALVPVHLCLCTCACALVPV